MSELIYDINTALKDIVDWDTLNDGNVPDFMPIYGYETTTVPFVLYAFIPRVVSTEKYYQHKDFIRYYVYDTDIDRMWAISAAIRDVLNCPFNEGLQELKDSVPVDSDWRILWSVLRTGLTTAPVEREGFSNTNNEFEIAYVAL